MLGIKKISWYNSKFDVNPLFFLIGFLIGIPLAYLIGISRDYNIIFFMSYIIIFMFGSFAFIFTMKLKFEYVKIGISNKFLYIDKHKSKKNYEWNTIKKIFHSKPRTLIIYFIKDKNRGNLPQKFVSNIKDIKKIKDDLNQRNISIKLEGSREFNN